MKSEYEKQKKYQLSIVDHEVLKLKPHALLVTSVGEMTIGESVCFFSRPEHLEDDNFTIRTVKEISKGNDPRTELVTLLDSDLIIAEVVDQHTAKENEKKLEEIRKKRKEEEDYKQSLFLQCQKDMEEFD